MALLALCRERPALGRSARAQAAIGRGIALALPPNVSAPRLLRGLLSPDECAALLAAAVAHGEAHGWGSLHRKYPTVDLPVAKLRGGGAVVSALQERAFPAFGRFFGEAYGPANALVMRDCFVAKYEAGGQSGLAGHVDASLLSLVMTLSPPGEFEGGGTHFEHAGRTLSPPQGDAVLFLGKVFHEGRPITRGTRFVLVALVDKRGTVAPPPPRPDEAAAGEAADSAEAADSVEGRG